MAQVTVRTLRFMQSLWILFILSQALPGIAGDWPAFRHDVQRSAVNSETLTFPLQLAWQYTCAQPPAPAWRPISKDA